MYYIYGANGTIYLCSKTKLERAPQYWEYVKEDDVWNLYYVKRGVSRRLAVYNIGHLKPSAIEARLQDRDISVIDCKHIEENMHKNRCIGKRIVFTNNWSIEFDGKSVLELLAEKPKMSYSEVLNVIQNEGGYVDSKGIVHRGTAKNKEVTLD
jgi:hypothetical protein